MPVRIRQKRQRHGAESESITGEPPESRALAGISSSQKIRDPARSKLSLQSFPDSDVALLGASGTATHAESIMEPESFSEAEWVRVWACFAIAYSCATQPFEDFEREIIQRWRSLSHDLVA
jgi:hypothetical protein